MRIALQLILYRFSDTNISWQIILSKGHIESVTYLPCWVSQNVDFIHSFPHNFGIYTLRGKKFGILIQKRMLYKDPEPFFRYEIFLFLKSCAIPQKYTHKKKSNFKCNFFRMFLLIFCERYPPPPFSFLAQGSDRSYTNLFSL